MAIVKLSSRAKRKKLITVIINKSFDLLVVFIFRVITSNPSCESISSTIVMAPNKKNNIEEIPPM